jgi:hypothetical protein
MSDTPDYDIPDVPETVAVGVVIDGSGDAGMLDGVPEMGEPIPIGTYHFRLSKYEAKQTIPDPTKPVETPEFYYALQFTCQQEPYVGRIHFDNCAWVRKETRQAALAGDPEARTLLNNRLVRAKALMEAAGFKPTGTFDFEKDFLATNPELLIQIGLQEGKTKSPDGKLISSGSFRNKTVKYVPIRRK